MVESLFSKQETRVRSSPPVLMNTIFLTDGIVEYCMADSLSGPNDCFGPLHVNSNVCWYRINGEGWQISPYRSNHRTREYLEICETVEDVRNIMR